MPNYTQRPVNTFVKGLITEAGELTFPENASVDELNCELFRDGSRRRRKALDLESGAAQSSFTTTEDTLIHFGEWSNVGNDPDTQYVVAQIGSRLYFYDKNTVPYSAAEQDFFVDLTQFQVPGAEPAGTYNCDFATILGNLVVVSQVTEPFYVTADGEGNLVSVSINCRVRDFKWLGDRSSYEDQEASPPLFRQYDTYNSGWTGEKGSAALTTYTTAETAWPPLTHPWYSGKDSSGNFSVAEWEKVYTGNSLLGNGHFILDLFSKDREAASGLTGLADAIDASVDTFFTGGSTYTSTWSGLTTSDVVETTRFTTVISFSSRVFFAGLRSSGNTGKIYFSQILQDMTNIGDFFQSNDPTSETISDLLDTDGGVIVIPDATEIKKLYAFNSSIFVFADNGVWQIQGVDQVFTPTAYSIRRITDMGVISSSAFTAAEGVPFWWSKHGIHTLTFNEYGNASEENLSVSTIQTFWDNISNVSKSRVISAYDKVNKKIFWMYPSDDRAFENDYNRVLILDVSLQAFYPWEFGDGDHKVVGLQFYAGLGRGDVNFDVVVSLDNVVVGSDNVVSTQTYALSDTSNNIVYFVRSDFDGRLTVALTASNSYLDWGTADYISFAETGYDFVEDLVLKKSAPYIVSYLRETETGWEGSEEVGYSPINESSLLMSCYWDFKKQPSSTPQQVYRRKNLYLVDSDNLEFNSKESVVTSRIKVRGRGRSLRIRIHSETGKDFIYLGHGLIADIAGRF